MKAGRGLEPKGSAYRLFLLALTPSKLQRAMNVTLKQGQHLGACPVCGMPGKYKVTDKGNEYYFHPLDCGHRMFVPKTDAEEARLQDFDGQCRCGDAGNA